MADLTGFVQSLLAKGYARNPCRPDSCHDEAEHAHLKTPEGDDVMAWADGSWSGYDLSQPARLIYPVMDAYDAILARRREGRFMRLPLPAGEASPGPDA